MASSFDKLKYKTYDTSNGFGSADNWKKAFHKRLSVGKVKEAKSYFSDCKTLKDLNKEFKKLIKLHHPDKVGETEENNRITKEIIEEYSKLKKDLV